MNTKYLYSFEIKGSIIYMFDVLNEAFPWKNCLVVMGWALTLLIYIYVMKYPFFVFRTFYNWLDSCHSWSCYLRQFGMCSSFCHWTSCQKWFTHFLFWLCQFSCRSFGFQGRSQPKSFVSRYYVYSIYLLDFDEFFWSNDGCCQCFFDEKYKNIFTKYCSLCDSSQLCLFIIYCGCHSQI